MGIKKKSKKILILRLGAIGDVVHTTIISAAIKQAHPDYTVHYLTQSEIAPMLINNPYIDKVIEWDRDKKGSIGYFFSLVSELYKERYDVVFNLTNAVRNILLSILAFPKRIVKKGRGTGLWVDEYFKTAKHVFPELEIPSRLYLGVSQNADKIVTEDIKDLPRPYTVFVPAGQTDKNRQGRIWNIDYWNELADSILNKYGGTIFVCGTKKEKKLHSKLKKDNVVIFSGKYSLEESCALLSKADLVVSGDTGPLHIASAYNVKTLALLGSTSPDKIEPYGANGNYISSDGDCLYCWKKKCIYLDKDSTYTPCMESLTPWMVMDKIIKMNLL